MCFAFLAYMGEPPLASSGWRLAVDVSGCRPVGRVSQPRDSGDAGATVKRYRMDWHCSSSAVRLLAVLCVAGCYAATAQVRAVNEQTDFSIPDCRPSNQSIQAEPLGDCSDLPTGTPSGIFLLQPCKNRNPRAFKAFCQMDKDGSHWTVIQRRADIEPRQDFNLSWSNYSNGFGDLNGEFWLGLENVYQMVSCGGQYKLRIDMKAFSLAKGYAQYGVFSIGSESEGYKLSVSNFTGNVIDRLSFDNNNKFSTRDVDQDEWRRGSCAKLRMSGWWYSWCSYTNLNGVYAGCTKNWLSRHLDFRGTVSPSP